jgi:hypothetical protein
MRIEFPKGPPKSGWRPWFAWRPVKVSGVWVWLEKVERRQVWHGPDVYGYTETQYRLILAEGE